MNLKINLDFCFIPSPYNKGMKNLVFLCYAGTNFVDERLCLEDDYEIVKNIMVQYGYQEIDFCIFESSNNTSIAPEDFKHKLVKIGMKYSKPFELNIMSELESFHMDLMSHQNLNTGYQTESDIYFPTASPIMSNKIKSKIPKVGEKITLHFYLFLQCHWINESDCVFELVGDLYSKENNNNRNFLQITKSDFVRLDSGIPNTIILQSTKSYGDFINELIFLYKFNFKFVKPIVNQNGDMIFKTKLFSCDLMEIKKIINPIHRIAVEADLNNHYDNMISVSKKIKKELEIEQKRFVSLDTVRPEILILKQKLKEKMLSLAESDEFEKANMVKNDISFIENKIKFIDNLEEKKITREEYLKTFCLDS